MFYILFYKTVENYIERRAPFRDEHLGLVHEFRNDGRLFMAGALAEPADRQLMILQTAIPTSGTDSSPNGL
jgi:uncharacterized protein YciI